MPRPTLRDDLERHSILFPRPLWDELRELATERTTTVSELLRRGARELLQREGGAEQKKGRRKTG